MTKCADNTAEQAIRVTRDRIDYDTREYPLEVIMGKYSHETGKKPEIYVPNICRSLDEWTEAKQSKFIESILIGVPLRTIVLRDEESTARLEVVDGKQRLFAIANFIGNTLALADLSILKELNGLTFQGLPRSRRLRFNRTTFRVIILSPSVDKEMRGYLRECMSSH